MEDFERRKGIRGKHEELSKYYELGGAQRSWATTNLLSKGKYENDRGMLCRFAHLGSLAVLEKVSNHPKPSREPPAQGSIDAEGPERYPADFPNGEKGKEGYDL